MLSAIVAVASAAPSGIHSYGALPVAVDHVDYHVSNHVHHVPTAVSHQSRVDYHSKPVITPVFAPVVKTVQAVHHAPIVVPAVHHAPLLHSAPLVHSAPYLGHSASYLHSAPLLHSEPLVHSEPWLGAHGW